MGNPVSTLRKELKEGKGDKEVKLEMEQRLEILQKMVQGRIDNVRTEILAGKAEYDQEIHSGTVVETHQQINMCLSDKPSQEWNTGIKDFFSGDCIGGLENIVKLGANSVLGNVTIGEYETKDMFIVWTSHALLRCDAFYYRWNFVSSGVIGNVEGAVGILLMKRVMDVTKIDPQVMTWAISRQAERQGKPEDETNMINSAMKVIEKVVAFQGKLKRLEAGAE